MSLLRSFARRLALTKFGQKSQTKPDGLSILKQKPDTRVYVGLVLLAMSFLIGLPALVFLTYLSVKLSKPMTITVGGPVVILLVHIIFGWVFIWPGRTTLQMCCNGRPNDFCKNTRN